jgi:membrane-associated phospholipid phosphatase
VQTAGAKQHGNALLASTRQLSMYMPHDETEKTSLTDKLLWLLVPLSFVILGFLALTIDCSLGRWCVEGKCPGPLRNLFSTMEPFGNGLGVAIIGIAIFCLDPLRRWALPRILCCAYLAGLAANGLKMLLARSRPYSFDFQGDVFSTFGNWFPMLSAGSSGQSFPSAHTTTAVALAAMLVWAYQRGWLLFPAMAVLVGCQRIDSGHHFPSDVFWGAALGSLIALAFLKFGSFPGLFGRFERRMRGES